MRSWITICALTLGLAACLCSCSPAIQQFPVSRGYEFRGEQIVVSVAGADANHLDGAERISSNTVRRIHKLLSIYEPDSEISSLNRVGNIVRLPVAPETLRVLEIAKEYNNLTEGAFDITVAPLAALWGFHGSHTPEKPVPKKMIQAVLKGIGNKHIRLYERSAELISPSTRIDLGGIIIGYTVDLSLIAMRQRGITNILMTMSGQTRCLGRPVENEYWKRDLFHPLHSDECIGTLTLSNGQAVAVSSATEDFVVIGGKRYGHVIDPRTGWPAEGLNSVTVTAPTATKADALSTALMVLGMEEGERILKNFPRCQALFVPKREPLEIWMTKGMAAQFKPTPDMAAAVRIINVAH